MLYSRVSNKHAACLLISKSIFRPTCTYWNQHVYSISRKVHTNTFVTTNTYWIAVSNEHFSWQISFKIIKISNCIWSNWFLELLPLHTNPFVPTNTFIIPTNMFIPTNTIICFSIIFLPILLFKSTCLFKTPEYFIFSETSNLFLLGQERSRA